MALDLTAIAEELKAAQDEVRQIEKFTSQLTDFDNSVAYEVSRIVHDARIADGAVAVGRKIGFTNPAMWDLYGVREPIWAHVYDRTVTHLAGPIGACRLGRFTEPKIEPEIVVHFGSTPPMTDNPVEILASIDWFAHGLEIVQSHFPDWKFQAADAIADAALHGHLVIGPRQEVDELGAGLVDDQATFDVALFSDGELRGTGKGSNVLGGPLRAIAHLIAVLAKQSAPLQAGELVTTGTLTVALPVRPGETWTTELSGIALPGSFRHVRGVTSHPLLAVVRSDDDAQCRVQASSGKTGDRQTGADSPSRCCRFQPSNVVPPQAAQGLDRRRRRPALLCTLSA